MPDILDIIIAKKLATGAAEAIERSAQEAIQSVEDASETIDETIAAAQQANEDAIAANEKMQEALASYEDLVSDVTDAVTENLDDTIDNKISDLAPITDVVIENDNTAAAKVKKIRVRKKNLESASEIMKNYTAKGQNEDGSMTQKAITAMFDELDAKIDEGGSGGGSTNLGPENADSIVIVGPDGNITSGAITQEELVNALIDAEVYDATQAVGLTIDYENRTFERTQDAKGYSAGYNFDQYPMYGGRKRCNVNLNGQIVAWYGEANYRDDGSNGDVMVYQPKFYYQRRPLKTDEGIVGKIIRKESIMVSAIKQPGFKLHPAFIDEYNNEIEYILLPAYESCYYDVSANTTITDDSGIIDFATDRLHSYGGVKPVSGLNNELTIENAERMARNHGTGWHILNMKALSITQMLAIIELGTLNGQAALELGVANVPDDTSYNTSSQTGSTASLGNSTGIAAETTNITNGITNVYNTNGRRAITYRGVENPWGNIWQFIGGVNIYGTGSNNAGVPYICSDFNYTANLIGSNYVSTGMALPSASSWISAFGYGTEEFDWVFMPAECVGATSALPVGDNAWTNSGFNGVGIVLYGGTSYHGANDGFFYYGCDRNYTLASRNVSARIMHIPTYGTTIYTANYNSWQMLNGG